MFYTRTQNCQRSNLNMVFADLVCFTQLVTEPFPRAGGSAVGDNKTHLAK